MRQSQLESFWPDLPILRHSGLDRALVSIEQSTSVVHIGHYQNGNSTERPVHGKNRDSTDATKG